VLVSVVRLRKVSSTAANRRPKRLTNSSYLSQTLALQTRQVQLEREKLRVAREKAEALKTIASELTTLRSLYMLVNGVNVFQQPEKPCNEQ